MLLKTMSKDLHSNNEETNRESHHRKKSRTSKRSESRDKSKQRADSKGTTSTKSEIVNRFIAKIFFKNSTCYSQLKHERIGNSKLILTPKMAFTPLGISKDLINSFKEKLNKCVTDNIPEVFSVQGSVSDKAIALFDYAQKDSRKNSSTRAS